jgi:hypothetical protein
MTRFTRLTMLSAMAAGLVACGGGAKLGGGEKGAAQAAYQASKPAGRFGFTSQQLVERALASGATTNAIFTAKCTKGGKASLTLDAVNLGQNGALNYSVSYDDCSEDGRNEYNGTVASSLRFALHENFSGFSFITTMKGKLTIEGEVSDFIEMDTTLTMAIGATSTTAGNVKLLVDGKVTTSQGAYLYVNENLDLSAGVLPPGA